MRIDVLPLGASVTIPEGMLLLDAATSRRFPLHSRNVRRAVLELWPVVQDDGEAFRRALALSRSGDIERDAPIRIEVPIAAQRDRLVSTAVDLTARLTEQSSYLATVRPMELAFDAEPMRYPSGSEASRPPVALLRVGSKDSLAVHTHQMATSILVHVSRLGTGEPVPGAAVSLLDGSNAKPVTTDGSGVAILDIHDSQAEGRLVRVDGPRRPLLVPVTGGQGTAEALFPHLATGTGPAHPSRRALLVSDRGIYRPGATLHVKASLFRPEGTGLVPDVAKLLRLKLVGPTGEVAVSYTHLRAHETS